MLQKYTGIDHKYSHSISFVLQNLNDTEIFSFYVTEFECMLWYKRYTDSIIDL